MAIYAIGDLHLSLGADKPMDVFSGWENHVECLEINWKNKVRGKDTVILAGDSSWGMTLQDSLADFQFIDQLPGKKLILKGNHDYWWASVGKMNSFFQNHGLDSLNILHNNSYYADGCWICGSRGWIFEKGGTHDQKIINREAVRLEASIQSTGQHPGERVVFLHYPPVYGEQISPQIIDVLVRHGIKRCYYGHIHGMAMKYASVGTYFGIQFSMVSADTIRFNPVRVQ